MIELLAVVCIAFLWAFLAGNLTTYNLIFGALLGIVLIAAIRRNERSLPRRTVAFVRYLLLFFKELTVANVVIALLALRPKPRFYPHIIAVPLEVESNAAIALLSATITLLPGTVAMGVSDDRRTLYAHAIGDARLTDAKESVKRMERAILRFMT